MIKGFPHVIKIIKPVVDNIGAGKLTRQAFVEMCMLGERAKFLLQGRPEPDTAILLAGSGRSGTTWLSTMITSIPGTQEIFEPLYQLWNKEFCDLIGWDFGPDEFEKYKAYFRTVYLSPDFRDPIWENMFYRILTGQVRNYWTDPIRNSYFPDRFVIKEIRANMMLGFLYRNFHPRVIYIVRHPCAVIASRLMVRIPWSANVSDLLSQEELVEDYLHPWVKQIEKEKDLLGAHAVWWAAENMIALNDLTSIPHHFVKFETMLLEPEKETLRLSEWLGNKFNQEKVSSAISRESRMSRKKVSSVEDRLNFWQKELSEEQQKRIIWWSREMGIPYYTDALLPN